ncbi:hypothetical protein LCGC14_2079930, partial [marine sediment metagenome]
ITTLGMGKLLLLLDCCTEKNPCVFHRLPQAEVELD